MYIDREDFSTRLNLLDQIKRSENYGVTYINYMNMIGKAFQTTYQEALEMDKDYEIRNLIDSVLLIRELSVFVNELNQYLSQPTLFDREIMFGELDQFMMDLNNNQYLLIDLVSPSETVVIAERKKYKVYCPSVMPDTVTLFDPVVYISLNVLYFFDTVSEVFNVTIGNVNVVSDSVVVDNVHDGLVVCNIIFLYFFFYVIN